jgi:hypothetical protein
LFAFIVCLCGFFALIGWLAEYFTRKEIKDHERRRNFRP